MNEYQEARKRLEDRRCKRCAGAGQVDDAEPGDIAMNIYQCGDCSGSGLSSSGKPEANIDELTKRRLDVLRRYNAWERKNRHNVDDQHVLDWAADTIERLLAEQGNDDA